MPTDQRPTYESAGDRANEAEVSSIIALRWKCEAVKLPVKYRLDYALVRGVRVGAYLEVKDRPRYSWGYLADFGGYRLSQHKWIAAEKLALDMGLPFLLAVRAAGDLRYLKVKPGDKCDGPPIMAGRKDRGDWQDQEPHVVFHVERFRKI